MGRYNRPTRPRRANEEKEWVPQNVATCRQTVDAFLAPLSTAWQRMATIRQLSQTKTELRTQEMRKNLEKANTECKKTEGGVTSVQRLLIRRGKIDIWNLSNTFRATRLRVPAQAMGRTKESKNTVMFPSPTDTRASLIVRLRDREDSLAES